MNASDPASPRPPARDAAVRDALLELVSLGVRVARVAAAFVEAEQRIVDVVGAEMPEGLVATGTAHEAQMAGLTVDAVDAALALGAPRVAAMTQAFERASRAVRRTAALIERIDAGWLRGRGPDDRQAMARRQVRRSVGERITRHADGEAAERLFDDLDERLDALEFGGDLDRPVDAVIAAICRALGLPDPERDLAEARRMPGDDGTLSGYRPDG